ncbi:hypothetical protein TSUD_152690 [Trifolium subterraneum]|uniref:Protein kinase domain-containing protein n=1 Tax=Trifolium subterraneum TaxID=3900 RepID=A0A2Z6NMN4_TRISU|nr:hypothetical protein TSUD_152690 [Trifolium subterraneum]
MQWQALEVLRRQTQTCAIDVFSLGCLFFFCLSGGHHPLGDGPTHDDNILQNKKDLTSILMPCLCFLFAWYFEKMFPKLLFAIYKIATK